MQVFSPTALASGTCGFDATWAWANPGAGLGIPLRSTVPSAEKFVEGSELDWPIAGGHTRNTVAIAIRTLHRPTLMPCSRRPEARVPKAAFLYARDRSMVRPQIG